jgi:hypothetical protein
LYNPTHFYRRAAAKPPPANPTPFSKPKLTFHVKYAIMQTSFPYRQKGRQMTVLSNRIRRHLPYWFSWHNIRFQWVVIAAIALTLLWIASYEGSLFEATWYSFTYRITLAFIFVQFGHAAWKNPDPLDEPYLVKKYADLKRWWKHIAAPGYYGTPRSTAELRIIRQIFCDFSEIYDLNGDLVGHEQDVWNDGYWTFKPVDADSQERIPLIAFWLTKRRKPVGMR